MRPVSAPLGPPPGYVMESAVVTYNNKRTFAVTREAQCDYGPGTPIILVQQGRLIHAAVDTYIYNGTKMVITPNVPVDPSIVGIYRDTSAPFVFGANPSYLSALYHFETSALYDSSAHGYDQNTAGVYLWGAAPSVLSNLSKFGSQCYQINGGTAFCSAPGSQITYPTMMPWGQMGAGQWCYEAWFYGIPTGYVSLWLTASYWGNYYYGYLGFNSGYPCVVQLSQSSNNPQYLINIQNSTPCLANKWNHVAWCRDWTGYIRTAVNGVFGSASNYGSPTIGGMCLFGNLVGNAAESNLNNIVTVSGSFNGTIDEMRITVGFCPYQGGYSFAPPTKPFGPDFR